VFAAPEVATPTQKVAPAEPPKPAPYVEPDRTLVTAVEEPVFSLASVGNETPPSAPGAPQPEVLAGSEGTIWYVKPVKACSGWRGK